MKATVAHLENALKAWQATMLWRKLYSQAEISLCGVTAVPLDGPIINAERFRDYLLMAFMPGNSEFDWTTFVSGSNAATRGYLSSLPGFINIVPAELYHWTRSSRRLYTMNSDLQALLALSELEDVTWSDVHWPFDSFAVQLEIPIKSEEGVLFDFVLVSKMMIPGHDKEVIALHLYTESFKKQAIQFAKHELKEIQKYSERNQFDRVITILHRVLIAWNRANERSSLLLIEKKDWDRKITEHIGSYIKDGFSPGLRHDDWDEATRLVVGMVLYLRSLPAKSHHRGEWLPVHTDFKDQRAVSKSAEVCTVTTCFTLSEELKGMVELVKKIGLRQALIEMGTHFRAGHWRRPPGMGQIDGAEKTVQVLPTIVRLDRLASGTVPAGSQVNLKR